MRASTRRSSPPGPTTRRSSTARPGATCAASKSPTTRASRDSIPRPASGCPLRRRSRPRGRIWRGAFRRCAVRRWCARVCASTNARRIRTWCWTAIRSGKTCGWPAAAPATGATACRQIEYVSMRPLDEAGFRYSSIQQLQQMDVTKPEVDELVKAAKGGVGEAACVLLVETARAQKTHFAEGDAAASLHAAGIADQAVVELAGLRQLGAWAGEAAAIRLTGTSDRVIIAVAKGRAAGQPEPSGALLARMKDAGVSE